MHVQIISHWNTIRTNIKKSTGQSDSEHSTVQPEPETTANSINFSLDSRSKDHRVSTNETDVRTYFKATGIFKLRTVPTNSYNNSKIFLCGMTRGGGGGGREEDLNKGFEIQKENWGNHAFLFTRLSLRWIFSEEESSFFSSKIKGAPNGNI